MLTLSEIVNQTCPVHSGRAAWRSALVRLLKYPEIREALNGDQHPNYPEASLAAFRQLYDLRQKGYEPRELVRRIREAGPVASPDDRQPVSDYPLTGQPPAPSTGMELTVQPHQVQDVIRLVGEYVAASTADLLRNQILPPIEDRLIRADAAADLLACGAGTVHQQLKRWGVDPVAMRPRRWRRSDVLRAIARL